jgi:hypothetical protein
MNERTSDEADFQPTRHDTFALIGTRCSREVAWRPNRSTERVGYFCAHSQKESFFTKTWRPSEIELVK